MWYLYIINIILCLNLFQPLKTIHIIPHSQASGACLPAPAVGPREAGQISKCVYCSGRMERGMMGWGNQRTAGPSGYGRGSSTDHTGRGAQRTVGTTGAAGAASWEAGWDGESVLTGTTSLSPEARGTHGNPQPLPHTVLTSDHPGDKVRIIYTQTAHRKRLSSCNLASLYFLLSKERNA